MSVVPDSGEEQVPWVSAQLTRTLFAALPTIAVINLGTLVSGGTAWWRSGDLVIALATAVGLVFGLSRIIICYLFLQGGEQLEPRPSDETWTMLNLVTGICFSACLGIVAGRAIYLGQVLPMLLSTTIATGYAFGVIARASALPRIASWQIIALFVPLVITGALMDDRAYLALSAIMMLFCFASLQLSGHVGATMKARLMAEHRLWVRARTDHLTGLVNRAAVETHGARQLQRAVMGGTSLAVALVDLDGFKPVNDTYGHSAGDEMLRQVGTRIEAVLEGRHMAARLGGDEFVIVFELETSFDEAIGLSDRIVFAMQRPFDICEQAVRISASVGLTRSEPDEAGFGALLHRADKALYEAKTQGRNRARVVYGDAAAA